MNISEELRYTETHEWVRMENEIAVIGISDYAQSELGDVVYVGLPEEGDEAVAGESIGDIESVKAVSDLVSPVSGIVCEVNEILADSPELLNQDPYGTWILKVREVGKTVRLLDPSEYETFCEKEG